MKHSIFYRWAILTLTLISCWGFSINAQVQNTYYHNLTKDYYSVVESPYNPGHKVHAGTIAGPGGHDVHIMELDPAGNVVWERLFQTGNDDRAFHIDLANNGYIVCGLTVVNGFNETLAILIDPMGNITNQKSYKDTHFGAHSQGLHVTSGLQDPNGGFAIAGFAATSITNTGQKAAMLMKLDGALNVQWVQYIESPQGSNNDYDMGSHVEEANGKGYFLSGSENRQNGDQTVLGVLFDYNGGLLWQTEYDDHTGAGHYSVGASAYYDPNTDEIYQLANFSIIHHFGVTVYDVPSGMRNVSKSWETFSNLGYANIEGFKIMQSQDPNNLIISGFMRDHTWPEVDEFGNATGVYHSGTPPFMMEVDKNGSTILWDQMFLIPSAGYNATGGFFGPFSAGQQPRINHTEIAIAKSDGQGYWLNAYRGSGSMFDLEVIETDLMGRNNCSSAPLGLIFNPVNWIDENNLTLVSTQLLQSPGPLDPMSIAGTFIPCPDQTANPCDITADFNYVVVDCLVEFFDVSTGDMSLCYDWDFGDGGVDVGNPNPFHTYTASGTYTVCLNVCCADADGNLTYQTICKDITVDCGCDQDATFTVDPMADCCYAFADLTPEPDSPNDPCDNWEITDDTGIIIATSTGDNWTHCFTQSGTYTVCHTDCCLNTDGTITEVTSCQTIVVDCGCDIYDPTVEPILSAISYIDCDYTTLMISLGYNGLYCTEFEFEGVLYTTTYDAVSDIYSVTFPTPCNGTYTGTVTIYCCDDTSLAITQTITFTIDSLCCRLPSSATAQATMLTLCNEFDFSAIIPAGECLDNLIYTWNFGDGSPTATGANVGHMYAADGIYTACVTISCSLDPTLPSIIACVDVIVDCCDADSNFTIDPMADCCFAFSDLTPEPDSPNDPCDYWEIADAFGTIVATSTGDFWTHCFTQSGVYTVCHTDCCLNADGTLTEITSCQSIDVDCGCSIPDFDFSWGISSTPICEDGCAVGFNCPILDPAIHCVSWDFGDGTPNFTDVNSCPIHCYAASGTYTVCLTVYCCEDDTQSFTVCHEVTVDCGCDQDASFTIDPMQDCCYAFADLTPDPAGTTNPCNNWEILDPMGNSIASSVGDFWTYCFTQSGTYTICHTDCCENADGTITEVTSCQTIDVDCGCDVDPTFVIDPMADCCYAFADLTPSPAGTIDPCNDWEIVDAFGNVVATSTGDFWTYCFTMSGTYTICHTDCCENADGTLSAITHCETIDVDCGCEVDPFFAIDPMDDCCYAFADLTPDPNEVTNNTCNIWEITDAFGNVIATSSGDFWTYCFDQSGTYTICHTDCCENADGTLSAITHCETIEVDCGCTLPFDWFPTVDGCTVCITPIFEGPNPTDCFFYDYGDGTTGTDPCHTYSASGAYTVCMTACCCENIDPLTGLPIDTTMCTTICKTITVDCGCDVDPTFVIDPMADCCYAFADLTPDPNELTNNTCNVWIITDAFGNVIANASGDFWTHCFEISGTYTICHTDCCTNADGTITEVTSCQTIDVDCPGCILPDLIDFEIVLDAGNCEIGACVTPTSLDPTIYCSTWDWGDGTVENHPLNFCPIHTYANSGTYTVCVTVYCCEDPTNGITVCHDITVDCGGCPEPCELHPAFIYEMFPITQADGCCMQFTDLSSTGMFTSITSWNWNFGDGNTSNQEDPMHCYDTPGNYTVCLTITGQSPEGTCTAEFCWTVMCDCTDTCPSDINGDGFVNLADLLEFLGNFNTACQ